MGPGYGRLVRSVAFVRNVNQGQRGHPSTADVLGAFADVGVEAAVVFQSNGTVVFSGSPSTVLAGDVSEALIRRTGLEREVFVLPMDELVRVVDEHGVAPDAARRELTLHGGGVLGVSDELTVSTASHRRCVVLAAGPGWAVTANERDRESNATPVIERLTGGPATSRGMPTLTRLVERFGDAAGGAG